MIYGIDISSWQGDIDLAALKPGFVIIRGGAGRSVDEKAVHNMDLCDRLGIPYGVYWYSYALSVEDAKAEAARCLTLIAGREIHVGVWIDMEDADGYKQKNGALRRDLTSAMAYAFAEKVEDAGYYAGIYASLSWIKDGWLDGCERFDKWVACWGKNTGQLDTDTAAYGSLHQYAGDIQRDGYRIDLDVSYVPLSRFSREAEKPPDDEPDEPSEEGDYPSICWPPRMLCVGMVGPDVTALQALLLCHGYNCGGCSGIFDGRTRNMVIGFQAESGLTQDGIAGPKTFRKLGVSV